MLVLVVLLMLMPVAVVAVFFELSVRLFGFLWFGLLGGALLV